MTNITYTTQSLVAPPLPLNYDPLLHGSITANRASAVVGSVHNVSELYQTLWNQQQGQCNRLHVLLIAKDFSIAPREGLTIPAQVASNGLPTGGNVAELGRWPPPGTPVFECIA
jgi:hypothetical protein